MKTTNQIDYIKWTLECLYTFSIQKVLIIKWLIPPQEYYGSRKRFQVPKGFHLRQLGDSKTYLFSLRGIQLKLITDLFVHCFYGEIEPTEYRLH